MLRQFIITLCLWSNSFNTSLTSSCSFLTASRCFLFVSSAAHGDKPHSWSLGGNTYNYNKKNKSCNNNILAIY